LHFPSYFIYIYVHYDNSSKRSEQRRLIARFNNYAIVGIVVHDANIGRNRKYRYMNNNNSNRRKKEEQREKPSLSG
jgi:hypothetical protein